MNIDALSRAVAQSGSKIVSKVSEAVPETAEKLADKVKGGASDTLLSDLDNLAARNIPSVSLGMGKHKLPRYLYHFTGEFYLDKILDSGHIGMSSGDIAGVYLTDMNNLQKCWKYRIIDGEQKGSLLGALMRKAAPYNGSHLYALKVPTESLDIDSLAIRSINKSYSPLYNRSYCPTDSIKNLPLYNQRKEAVEFVYSKPIPVKDCTIIGPAESFYMGRNFEQQHPRALSLLSQLFEGLPEQKGFEAQLKNMNL